MTALDDLRHVLDDIAATRAAEPVGIVRSDMVPIDRAMGMATTRGVYLLVNPEVLAKLPVAQPSPHTIDHLFGIPVLDNLPDDAEPLGIEVTWASISAEDFA